MEQQEQTKEIRNNENEREMEGEWLALRSGMLSVELQGTVCPLVFYLSILNKQAETPLRTISFQDGCISIACFCFLYSELTWWHKCLFKCLNQ